MYTIGQVSEMFGLPISTLRYYDKQGLFPGMERISGIRKFSEKEIETLRVIECLKRSGLEIKDIKQFMDWVYGVKYKGRQLSIGEKVPTGAVLTLMVGDGGALKADSLGVDAVGGTVEPVLSEDSAADESWF